MLQYTESNTNLAVADFFFDIKVIIVFYLALSVCERLSLEALVTGIAIPAE